MKQMFKKLILASILSLSALTALASPSPKQVEKALAAGDYQAARSMTQEVLRDHPNSAKAHLFNAYLLQHVDRNKQAANEELKQVVRLDKSGDVAGSALFGKVVAEIEAPVPAARKYVERQVIAQPQTRVASYAQPVQPSTSGSHTIVWMLGGLFFVAVAAGVVYAATRKPEVVVHTFNPVSERRSVSWENTPTTYDRSESFNSRERAAVRSVYQAPPSQVYMQPVPQQTQQQQGMGALGTAASVAGGVVAGNMISDMLHSGHNSHRREVDDYGSTELVRRRYEEPAYEAPAKVDYEVKEASYSSGRDDSWTSTPSYSSSSSSRDDSWTSSDSSSSDYSSSSSDYSSSSDSGGGSWD